MGQWQGHWSRWRSLNKIQRIRDLETLGKNNWIVCVLTPGKQSTTEVHIELFLDYVGTSAHQT
jgi:hypothetical protein